MNSDPLTFSTPVPAAWWVTDQSWFQLPPPSPAPPAPPLWPPPRQPGLPVAAPLYITALAGGTSKSADPAELAFYSICGAVVVIVLAIVIRYYWWDREQMRRSAGPKEHALEIDGGAAPAAHGENEPGEIMGEIHAQRMCALLSGDDAMLPAPQTLPAPALPTPQALPPPRGTSTSMPPPVALPPPPQSKPKLRPMKSSHQLEVSLAAPREAPPSNRRSKCNDSQLPSPRQLPAPSESGGVEAISQRL